MKIAFLFGLVLFHTAAHAAEVVDPRESPLLDLQVIEEIADLMDHESAPYLKSRSVWNQVLETSTFNLPTFAVKENFHPLMNHEMPGSQPRWVTGRSDMVRPFAYDELREPSRSAAEFEYFQNVEQELISRSARAAALRARPEFIAWTESWIARELQNFSRKSEKQDPAPRCERIARALAARALLSGGQVNSRASKLMIYGLSVGAEFDLHPCKELPRMSWGLPVLKHPRTGTVEVDSRNGKRGHGSIENFAKILSTGSDSYVKLFDWVVTYDETRMVADLGSEGSIEISKGQLSLSPPLESSKIGSFANLIKFWATEQQTFEKQVHRAR